MLTEISIFFFPSGISSETPSDVLAAVHPVSDAWEIEMELEAAERPQRHESTQKEPNTDVEHTTTIVSSRSAGTVSPCQLLYSTSPAKGSKTRLLETFQWKETE